MILGITGDLARKKLMPAMHDPANRGLLPPGFALVGCARRDWTDEQFAAVVREAVQASSRTRLREEVGTQLARSIRFVQGTFDDAAGSDRLRDALDALDTERGTRGNATFHLSIPPKDFPQVTEHLSSATSRRRTSPCPGAVCETASRRSCGDSIRTTSTVWC